MAVRTVLWYPDERLRQKAEPVSEVDDTIRSLVDDMFDTMYDDEYGGGLAAVQIGVYQRVIVMDLSREKNQPLHFINPEIIETRGQILMDEGCLSLPGVYIPVERPEWVKVKALDRDGKEFVGEYDDWTARCVFHEIDHLNGILSIDHLTPLKRQRAIKKMEKAIRHMKKL